MRRRWGRRCRRQEVQEAGGAGGRRCRRQEAQNAQEVPVLHV